MIEWQFAAVADRRLVTKLEDERDEARRIAEAYRDVWEMCSAAVDTCPNPDPLPWQDISSANDAITDDGSRSSNQNQSMNSNQNSPTKPEACKSFGGSHC
jgi:hypothetical protein